MDKIKLYESLLSDWARWCAEGEQTPKPLTRSIFEVMDSPGSTPPGPKPLVRGRMGASVECRIDRVLRARFDPVRLRALFVFMLDVRLSVSQRAKIAQMSVKTLYNIKKEAVSVLLSSRI